MIDWEKVLFLLKLITSLEGSLKNVLEEMYTNKGLSLMEITSFVSQEVSYVSLRRKMLDLGIKLRNRGGDNWKKKIRTSTGCPIGVMYL